MYRNFKLIPTLIFQNNSLQPVVNGNGRGADILIKGLNNILTKTKAL